MNLTGRIHDTQLACGIDFVLSINRTIDGENVDWTGYTVQFSASRGKSGSGSDFSWSTDDYIATDSIGNVEIDVPASVTSQIKPGKYSYKIVYTAPDDAVGLLIHGSIDVRDL